MKEYYKYRCCNSELKHPYKKVFDSKQIDLLVFEQLSSEIRQLNKDKLFNKMQEEVKLVTKSLVEEKQSVKGKIDKVYLAIENFFSILSGQVTMKWSAFMRGVFENTG